MTLRVKNPPPIAVWPSDAAAARERERRKTRLMAILSRGLPTLPDYVLDLNALLKTSPVDLKAVGKVIRRDPSLSAQVLRVCNSAMFGLRRRVINIEEAAILLGVDRLRTLVLTCSVMQFASKRLPPEQLSTFWQHSFLTALLSERIAQLTGYSEKEQAYLGGLLHDFGQLPLWMLVIEETAASRTPPPENWADNIQLEQDYFGLDHCKVGRWIAVAWNFMPSFFDVFEFHHHLEESAHDPYLAGIVAAADRFLATQTEYAAHSENSLAADNTTLDDQSEHSGEQLRGPHPHLENQTQQITHHGTAHAEDCAFLHDCLPLISESEYPAILDMLRTEYIHLLPVVIGATSATMSDA